MLTYEEARSAVQIVVNSIRELRVANLWRERRTAIRGSCLGEQWVSLLVGVAFILYAARLFRVTSRYAVNVFYSDQSEFNDATLFQEHSLWQMFDWQPAASAGAGRAV